MVGTLAHDYAKANIRTTSRRSMMMPHWLQALDAGRIDALVTSTVECVHGAVRAGQDAKVLGRLPDSEDKSGMGIGGEGFQADCSRDQGSG